MSHSELVTTDFKLIHCFVRSAGMFMSIHVAQNIPVYEKIHMDLLFFCFWCLRKTEMHCG